MKGKIQLSFIVLGLLCCCLSCGAFDLRHRRGFQMELSDALESLRKVLDDTRNPQILQDTSFAYGDSFFLAEAMTLLGLGSHHNTFSLMDPFSEHLEKIVEWAKSGKVFLRFEAQELCDFDHEETKELLETNIASEELTDFGRRVVSTKSVSRKVTEYAWKFELRYILSVYSPIHPDHHIKLIERSTNTLITTFTSLPPRAKIFLTDPLEADLTWYLQRYQNGVLNFMIDRSAGQCKTPRRNKNIEEAFDYFQQIVHFYDRIHQYFVYNIFSLGQGNLGLDSSYLNFAAARVFNPMVPYLEQSPTNSTASFMPDVEALLVYQKKSLAEHFQGLGEMYPEPQSTFIGFKEMKLLNVVAILSKLATSWADSVNYIEDALSIRLNEALGQQISEAEFWRYMNQYHYSKLFKPEYTSSPFSYAIRQPGRYPDGLISLERNGIDAPVHVFSKLLHNSSNMELSINQDTKIPLHGEMHLHSLLEYQFGASEVALNLVARARQFSSFILLFGRVASPSKFVPEGGIIVKNKDQVKVLLTLSAIATPKNFKHLLNSLSPEQQRFAEAIRDLQLQNTLFGIAVVQIKPQLERLLNLTRGSLTKEIQLTEDLLDMFVNYQIPSDLFAYDSSCFTNPDSSSFPDPLTAVKNSVRSIKDMIHKQKNERIAEKNLKREYDNMYGGKYEGDGGSWQETGRGFERLQDTGRGFSRQEKTSGTRSSKGKFAAHMQNANLAQEFQYLYMADFTSIPKDMDEKFEKMDEDDAIHPVVIQSLQWTLETQESLLSDRSSTELGQKKKEKTNMAFDLLDALSRSGDLPIEDCMVHVIFSSVHQFSKTLLSSLVEENMNPIEKMERSALIMNSVLHSTIPADIVKPEELDRVKQFSPALF